MRDAVVKGIVGNLTLKVKIAVGTKIVLEPQAHFGQHHATATAAGEDHTVVVACGIGRIGRGGG